MIGVELLAPTTNEILIFIGKRQEHLIGGFSTTSQMISQTVQFFGMFSGVSIGMEILQKI
jgi:hypothetical protein